MMFRVLHNGKTVNADGGYEDGYSFVTLAEATVVAEHVGGCTVEPLVDPGGFPPEVLRVHDKIENLVDKKLAQKEQSMVIVGLHTGAGKTTGFRKAVAKRNDIRVLIACVTVESADEMYLKLLEEGVPKEDLGIWTSAHDTVKPRDVNTFKHRDAAATFSKRDADKRRVLIVTHQGEKNDDRWLNTDRDLVLVDEYPNPSEVVSLLRQDILDAGDDERRYSRERDLLQKLSDELNGLAKTIKHGAHKLNLPIVVGEIAECDTFQSKKARVVKDWAIAAMEGRGFYSHLGFPTLTSFTFNLPFAEKTILFSATAHLEGWHFNKGLDIIDKRAASFPDLTFTHVPLTEGADLKAPEMLRRSDKVLEAMRRDMEPDLLRHNQTLIVMPLKLRERMEAAGVFDDLVESGQVALNHYGRGEGSNEWQDFDAVYLLLDDHKPADAFIGHRHGHGGYSHTDEKILKDMGNVKSTSLRSMRQDNSLRSMFQMVGRGCMRQGKPMAVYHMGDIMLVSRLHEILPDCEVIIRGPIDCAGRDPIEKKLAAYLLGETKPKITLPEVEVALSKRATRRDMLVENRLMWEAVGYELKLGTGRGNPTYFDRLPT